MSSAHFRRGKGSVGSRATCRLFVQRRTPLCKHLPQATTGFHQGNNSRNGERLLLLCAERLILLAPKTIKFLYSLCWLCVEIFCARWQMPQVVYFVDDLTFYTTCRCSMLAGWGGGGVRLSWTSETEKHAHCPNSELLWRSKEKEPQRKTIVVLLSIIAKRLWRFSQRRRLILALVLKSVWNVRQRCNHWRIRWSHKIRLHGAVSLLPSSKRWLISCPRKWVDLYSPGWLTLQGFPFQN